MLVAAGCAPSLPPFLPPKPDCHCEAIVVICMPPKLGYKQDAHYNQPGCLHALYSGKANDGRHFCPCEQCVSSLQKHSPLVLQPGDSVCGARAAKASNSCGWKILWGSLLLLNSSIFCQRGRWSRMGQLGCLKERSWFLPLQVSSSMNINTQTQQQD